MTKTSHIFLSLVAFSSCLLIFVHGGTSHFFQLGALTLLLGAASFRLIVSVQGGSIVWSRLHSWLLVYSVFIISNLFTSILVENSRVIVWTFLTLPLVIFILGPLDDERWKTLLVYLSLPMLLSAAWGIGIYTFTAEKRGAGFVTDPNAWTAGLNIFFFALTSWYLLINSRWRWVLLGVLLIVAIAAYVSYSRAGVFILMVGLGVVILLSLMDRKMLRWSITLATLVGLSFALILQLQPASGRTFAYTKNPGYDSWGVRIAQWQAVSQQALDHPIFGSGLGTFKVLYPQNRQVRDSVSSGDHAHNDYLQLVAEAGPAALIFVAALVGFLLFRLFKSGRVLLTANRDNIPDDERRRQLEIMILIVAAGTTFVHSLLTFTFYLMLNQFLIGCVLARIIWLCNVTSEVTLSVSRKSQVSGLACVVLALVLIVEWSDGLVRHVVNYGGSIPFASAEEKPIQALRFLTLAKTYRPENSAIRHGLASFYAASFASLPEETEKQSLGIVAALEYQSALEINPYSTDTRVLLTNFLIENPELQTVDEIYQTPEQLLREGVSLAPVEMRSHILLAEFLDQTGRSDEAYEVLKAAIHCAPMKYAFYRYWRVRFQTKLLAMAEQRDDSDTLNLLLKSMPN